MFYTVYQIENLVNGKIYIGCHKTKNLTDAYFGSGTIIRQAIKKYGKEKFKKTVLFIFDNEEKMLQKEKDLVNTDFLKKNSNYNIKLGGYGGWSYLDGEEYYENVSQVKKLKHKSQINRENKTTANHGVAYPMQNKEISNKAVNSNRITVNEKYGVNWITQTEESKRRQSQTQKESGRYLGSENPAFGKRWITNGTEDKLAIVQNNLPEGWRFGKTYKRKEGRKEKPSGFRWITDGSITKQTYSKEIPEGWRIGRSK